MTHFLVVFCTCPNQESATHLAHRLVESKLAACVNMLPHVSSVYLWKNQIETANEIVLMIKTSKMVYSSVEILIKEHHPYECPEIIGLPIEQGIKGYLQWLQDSISA